MARARNIKPSFFKNELLVELPFEYRLLFIGLWTMADRDGRIEDRPKRIKMELFPADDVNVAAGITRLEAMGFLERYTAAGVQVISITNFLKHQSPHHTEKKSDLPAKDALTTDEQPCVHGEPTVNHESACVEIPLNPDSLNHESKRPPAGSRAQPHDDRTRIPITQDWEPDGERMGAHLRMQGVVTSDLSQDECSYVIGEFVSYWVARPDAMHTQEQWEQKLVKQFRRALVEKASRPPKGTGPPRPSGTKYGNRQAFWEQLNGSGNGRTGTTERVIEGEAERVG